MRMRRVGKRLGSCGVCVVVALVAVVACESGDRQANAKAHRGVRLGEYPAGLDCRSGELRGREDSHRGLHAVNESPDG
jgi:hypothetical protein